MAKNPENKAQNTQENESVEKNSKFKINEKPTPTQNWPLIISK